MKNKVLVRLLVPELNETYDVFIPVNEVEWKVRKIIIKAIYDLTDGVLDSNIDYYLVNQNTGKIYKNNDIIIDTEIRNGTELVLFSK